jgi:hypothetical protein
MNLKLQQELIKIVGSEKSREVADLFERHGFELITQPGSVSIQFPNIEITSVDSTGEVPGRGNNQVRRFQFICKINGKQLKELQKIEIDPFDYDSGEPLNVKLTLIPTFGGDGDKD